MARVINVQTLLNKRYHEVTDIAERYQVLFGIPERNFKMAIAGPSTSGKSSWALLLADHLADVWGKTLYNSWEEGHGKTIQARAMERGIQSRKLYIADRMPFEEMLAKVKRNAYRISIIDSIRFMDLSEEQYRELVATHKRKAFIFIGHGDNYGKMEGGALIWKDADIKVFIKDGKAKISSRYTGGQVEIRLFKPKHYSSQISLL